MATDFNIFLLKWQNFAKSDHTDHHELTDLHFTVHAPDERPQLAAASKRPHHAHGRQLHQVRFGSINCKQIRAGLGQLGTLVERR